jgi:Coiled-coil domain containing protein (DUF2052).
LDDNIDEMMRLLHDRFVAGLDKHFDYASIDNDEYNIFPFLYILEHWMTKY